MENREVPMRTTRRRFVQGTLAAAAVSGAPGIVLLVRHGNQTTHITGGVADLATQRPPRGVVDIHRHAQQRQAERARLVREVGR